MKRRVAVNLSSVVADRLDAMRAPPNTRSRSQVVTNALKLYAWVVSEHAAGRQVSMISSSGEALDMRDPRIAVLVGPWPRANAVDPV